MIKLNHKSYNVPGLMVAMATGAKPAQHFASGSADVVMDAPITPDYCTQFAQITETLTSSIVLKCVKKFGLDLDQTLAQISTAFQNDNGRLRLIVNEYNQLKPVTLRDLLQHTSGLPAYDQTAQYIQRMIKNPRKVWQIEAYLDLITGTDVEYCYGYWPAKQGDHSLSATDYVLVGLVIEAVTGHPVSYEMTSLFNECELQLMRYSANGVLDAKAVPRLVHGYMPISYPYADIFGSLPVMTYNNNRELQVVDVTAAYNFNGLSGVAAWGSLSDLIMWMRLVWREKIFGDPIAQFFGKPVELVRHGKEVVAEVGLGFRRANLRQYGEVVWSKGRVYGYETLVAYSAAKDVTLAITVNTNRSPLRVLSGSELVDAVFADAFG